MIREIYSRDNRIYKECVRLGRKKYRDELGEYLIEGENLLREVMDLGREAEFIIFRKGRGLPEDIPNIPVRRGIYLMETDLFDKLADTVTSQGVIACVGKHDMDPEGLMGSGGPGDNYVILDRLQDPGNIGTIVRTAEAAGYAGVIAIKGTADIYSPKTVRAAAGSLMRSRIALAEDGAELIDILCRRGKKVVVTSPLGGTEYFDSDLRDDIALVIGNEGNGCSEAFIQNADVLLRIPMRGRVESLNAAVSASILMYESVRGDTV